MKLFHFCCIDLYKLLLVHNNHWKSILLTSNESVSSSSLDLSELSTKAIETGIIKLIFSNISREHQWAKAENFDQSQDSRPVEIGWNKSRMLTSPAYQPIDAPLYSS